MDGIAPTPPAMLGTSPPPMPGNIPPTPMPIDPSPRAFAPLAERASFWNPKLKKLVSSFQIQAKFSNIDKLLDPGQILDTKKLKKKKEYLRKLAYADNNRKYKTYLQGDLLLRLHKNVCLVRLGLPTEAHEAIDVLAQNHNRKQVVYHQRYIAFNHFLVLVMVTNGLLSHRSVSSNYCMLLG